MINEEIKPVLPISVVIPTAGRENLSPAINSVLSQTSLPREILICADGPVVDEDQLKFQFAEKHKSTIFRVIVSPYKSGGPAEPRNRGIQASTEPFVAFLDDDDTWVPNKLETQFTEFNNPDVVACGANAFVVLEGKVLGQYFDRMKHTLGLWDLARVNPLITSSMICKKASLIEAGEFDTNHEYAGIEDYLLWIKLAAIGDIVNLKECLVNYKKVSSQSLSSRINKGTSNPVTFARKEYVLWGLKRPKTFISAVAIAAYNWASLCLKLLSRNNKPDGAVG